MQLIPFFESQLSPIQSVTESPVINIMYSLDYLEECRKT